ncbi:MAG: hypothetical protein KDI32_06445 [Pseudomonadales bacterium]|nr:hypothetical protein [Pseudomonadales bacterium]
MTQPKVLTSIATLLLAALLGACGAEPDQLRRVRSFEVSSCNSELTTDPLDTEAAIQFRMQLTEKYFVRDRDVLIVANHETAAAASGVRQYRGPFYTYLHPRKLTDEDHARQIDWAGMVFLHAEGVRSRINGSNFGEWQRVRTRNFTDQTRASDGLTRWVCLKNAEIAWAEVTHEQGIWRVKPLAISVYETVDELQRLLPLPTPRQISGNEPVSPKIP